MLSRSRACECPGESFSVSFVQSLGTLEAAKVFKMHVLLGLGFHGGQHVCQGCRGSAAC